MSNTLLVLSVSLLSCGIALLASYARDFTLLSLARDCERIERESVARAIARIG